MENVFPHPGGPHKINDVILPDFIKDVEAMTERGYKNKEYTCEYVSNVIKELKQCKTEDGEVLDLDSYVGLIEHSIIDINNIIDSSGYYKSELLENYKWVKK